MSDQNDQQSDATPQEPQESEHGLKESLREGAAKVVGLAVEVGSMLSGESGEILTAEREIVEDKTEEFIDRIDGEG